MREPDFFERGRKQFVPYLLRDAPREAERLGVPFGLPIPDPITMDMETGKVAPDQPIMNMIMGLAYAAVEDDRGLEFAQTVGRSIWGGAQNWCEKEVLGDTLKAAGFNLEKLTAWAGENDAAIKKKLEANEEAQLIHHWGVPLMVLDGEPFFGQDRIDSLVWRLDRLGLRRD